jgi:quercetin dioxygenase-like cupin family protein/DNA-binding CsgD family transcriptional regulator
MNENASCLLKHGGTVPVLRITPWERDALQLLADGQTRNELSRHLGASASDIDSLLEALFATMGVATEAEAIAAARKRGLLWPSLIRASASSRDDGHRGGNMYRVRQEDLPYRGSSHNFVGADQGDVSISAFLFHGQPGSGPGPHWHPYDEVQFIREGRSRYVVEGKEFEAGPGDILVIKAGEIHSFTCIGDVPLVQLDVHLSPRFIQHDAVTQTIPGQ